MSELYATPYGKWSSYAGDGQIRLEYQFGTAGLAEFLQKVQEIAAYPTLELPGDGVCVWAVPGEKMEPLGQISVPMPPQTVRTLAGKILDELETLHQNGLIMGDFSPWLIWMTDDLKEIVLFPTPTLGPQVKVAPNGTAAMPFASADWERPVGMPNPVIADIYAFGCLLWFLLTGTSRKTSPMLASEFDPSLAAWDAFFDGCTRNNPARRFQTLEQVRAQIPTEARSVQSPVQSPVQRPMQSPVQRAVPRPASVPPRMPIPPVPARNPSESKSISRRNLLIGGAGVLGLGVVAMLSRSCGSVVRPSYRRGYGDTILAYQDRNYEGAKWVKVHTLKEDSYYDNQIVGWDDSKYWIYCFSPELLIEYSNHTYSVKAKEVKAEILLPISKDEIITFRSYSTPYLFNYINQTGRHRFSGKNNNIAGTARAWYQIDSNMFVAHVKSECVMYYNLLKDKIRLVSENEDKYFVHEENIPNRDWEISEIDCVKTVAAGHAFGMYEDILVEFKNNIWRKVKSCPFDPQVSYVDFRNGSLKGFIGADDEGRVFRYTEEGVFQIEIDTINSRNQETSLNIVQLWGVNMNKFWAMDSSGTIWMWENNKWRQVVRGLRDFSSGERDFEFQNTWISPAGIAYGVTNKALYKLEF